MVAIDLVALLIGQWQNAPRLRGIVEQIIGPDRDDALEALDDLAEFLNIDTTAGVWLDILAARLGLARPATSDPAADERFGFDDAGEPFDVAPFRGDAANDAVYPLPDETFRRFVRARALTVLSDGTAATIARAVREIDPAASVQDRRDMTIRVVTSQRQTIDLADVSGALPRPAGVAFVYADRGRFGFDDAGEPFDVGAFTPI